MLRVIFLLLVASLALAQVADPRCSEERPRPILLPNDNDCGLYYICHLGAPVQMPRCPAGLLFDAVSLSCRDEADVNCAPIATTTAPSTIPQEITTPLETIPPTTDPTGPPTAPIEVPTLPSNYKFERNQKL